jgi:hypothetical protein
MRKSLWIILAVLLGAGAGVARADSITFIVSGSLTVGSSSGASCPSPCTLGGTLTINNLTGAVISADITMSGESPTVSPFTTYRGIVYFDFDPWFLGWVRWGKFRTLIRQFIRDCLFRYLCSSRL